MTLTRPVSAIAGSVSVVAAATLAFVQSLPVTRWIGVGIFALIAIAAVVKEIAAHREKRREAQAKRDAGLRQPPVAVKDADPFSLGVTPSAIADRYRGNAATPPYVPRDIDPKIDHQLRHHPFLAIVGPSKAGKSRTAFEAVLRVYPERLLIAPELPTYQREGLASSLEACVREGAGRGVVIWLDDLQEFLRTRSIATQDINAWRAAHPQVVVVATIRDGELAGLRESGDSGADIEKVIEQAEIVPLPPLLSEREKVAAETAYPDEDFKDGIGVHLVAGPQLVERFVSAREANPSGFAVAAAAADRRRAGVFEAATAEELAELAPVYYQEIRPRSEFPREDLAAALKWAAEPVIQDIGVLLRAEGGKYEPFEYIAAFRDGEVAGGVGAADIPTETWHSLIDRHEGWTLRSIGQSAAFRQRHDLACLAFEKLSRDADPHAAAHGVDDLGAALRACGDETGAMERHRGAAASSYACVKASGSYRLALALDLTALAEREALYRTVLEHPNSWAYPKAAVNLGLLLRVKTSVESRRTKEATLFAYGEERSDGDRQIEDEAQELFELALESNDVEAIRNGANALGVLFCSRGDLEEGERALRKGIEAGGVQAAVSLALAIYDSPGREAEAWALIDQADRMGPGRNFDYLNMAAGIIAEARGDEDEAIARYRLVLTAENEGYEDDAARRLADLLARR